jgi:hypothetical protein
VLRKSPLVRSALRRSKIPVYARALQALVCSRLFSLRKKGTNRYPFLCPLFSPS